MNNVTDHPGSRYLVKNWYELLDEDSWWSGTVARAAAGARAAGPEGDGPVEPLPQFQERIELTDRAAQALKAALRKARAAGIRIDVRDGKDGRTYSLTLENRARASDVVLESKGVSLHFPPAQAEQMPELRIDYVRRDGREGFTISSLGGCGPGCGCGG